MHALKRLKAFLDRHIDYRGAVAGALVLGGVVFCINLDHGGSAAFVAAAKQGTYTFFAGGYMVRLNERIALAVEPALLAVPAGVLCAGGLAVLLTYLVHSARGTPEPVNSTLPTLVLAGFGFAFLGVRARRLRNARREEARGDGARGTAA